MPVGDAKDDRIKELFTPITGEAPDPLARTRPGLPYLVRTPSFSAHDSANRESRFLHEDDEGAARAAAAYCDPRPSLTAVKEKCEVAIDVMRDTFRQAVDRGNRMEALRDKSDALAETTNRFTAESRRLENMYYWQRILVPLVSLGLVALLMLILAFLNPYLFWFIVICLVGGLVSFIYFLAKRHHDRQRYASMPPDDIAVNI